RAGEVQLEGAHVVELDVEDVAVADGQLEARRPGEVAPLGDRRPPAADGAAVERGEVDLADAAGVGAGGLAEPFAGLAVGRAVVPTGVAVAAGRVVDDLAAELAQAVQRAARVEDRD